MKQQLRFASCLAVFVLLLSGCSLFETRDPQYKMVLSRQWVRTTLDKPFIEARRLHRMSPILTKNYVFVGNTIDSISSYSRRTGRLVWRKFIKGGVEGGAQLVDGILYFGANDGFFYALNSVDGEVKWTFPIRFEGLGEPLVDKGVVYVLAGNNIAYALDAETGKQVWLYNRRDPSSLSIRGGSRPAVTEKHVYIGFADGYVVSLQRANGQVEWETNINVNKRFRDVDAGAVIEGDRMYITSFDGGLYCLNVQTGQVVWSHDVGGYSSPIIEGNRLYYTTTNGKVMAVEKSTGAPIWTHSLGGKIATKPALNKGMLIFGEFEGNLKVISTQTGQLLAEFAPGRGVTSPPTLDPLKNEIYFMSIEANLFVLKLERTARVMENLIDQSI